MNGTANDWPFQYNAMEKEFTDPGPLYYSGGGQFYSPQLVRSLSETGATSSQGTSAGPAGADPSFFSPSNYPTEAENIGGGAAAGALAGLMIGSEVGPFGALAGAAIGAALGAIASFFEELFGGSSNQPEIPRQLLHQRHPLYRDILDVPDGLIPTEGSEGIKICGDAPSPCPTPSLQKPGPEQKIQACRQAAQAQLEQCFITMEAPSDFPKAAAAWVCAVGGEFGGWACAGMVAMEIPSAIAEGKCLNDYLNQIAACK